VQGTLCTIYFNVNLQDRSFQSASPIQMEFALSTSTSTKPQTKKHFSIGKEMMMMYIHKVCKCKMVPSLEGNERLVA
jgi:hypothetical protein